MSAHDLSSATVAQVSMRAVDLPRAKAFYREKLGLTIAVDAPNLAIMAAGSVTIMLSPAEKPEYDHPGSILYFRVADVAATHRELVSRGVTFVAPPHPVHKGPGFELWMGFLKDSEGNTLAIMETKKVG